MDYFIKEAVLKKRLDLFVHSLKLGLSRSQCRKLITEKHILVNDNPSKPAYRLKRDDKISVEIPPVRELQAGPENIPLDIVYEDEDIIVVNKKRGMVVHPAAGNYSHTLVNALLHHCEDLSGIGGVLRPGIVHRLDKDTSGVIVAAKNNAAHEALNRQFKSREVKKVYLAVVKGRLKNEEGVISEKIGRHPVHRKKMAVIKNSAKLKSREAVTFYKVLKKFNGFALLEVKPETGRTHQIRVHLNYIGNPIVGDPIYGEKGKTLMLHAKLLGFNHPRNGKHLEFEADMPADMKEFINNQLKENKGG